MITYIDGATLAVLNCYRNNYYADGHSTEQGLVANCINEVLPILLAVKNGEYQMVSEISKEIFDDIEQLMLDGEIGGKYPAKVINPDKYIELKKKWGVKTDNE